MKKDFNRAVKSLKKRQRNIYGVNNIFFRFLFAFFASLTFFSMFQPVFDQTLGILSFCVIIIAVSFIIAAVYAYVGKNNIATISPFCRQTGFHFIGLHDLSGVSAECSDVIPRNEEIKYMHKILEEIVFPQSDVKQALCLIGKSGCGKSTIISFFCSAYADEYDTYNFSSNYMNIKNTIVSEFGLNSDNKLDAVNVKKRVFIFDQFERYFFLPDDKRNELRLAISSLGRRNTAVIMSMREEYLAEFMNEFDMNDIRHERYTNNDSVTGILNSLVSIVHESPNALLLGNVASEKTIIWNGERVKNNGRMHVLPPVSGKKPVFEKLGATLLYCDSKSEGSMLLGGNDVPVEPMREKCQNVFGNESGNTFYDHHSKEPLIEQQIIFQMAEQYANENGFDTELLDSLYSENSTDLLNTYFDTQLCSIGDYYNTSRVMYLLSTARIHQMSIKVEDINSALFSKQFDKQGQIKLKDNIEALEKLQLIRRTHNKSVTEFEIAHDFIASAFITYSRSNMDRNVRAALDMYLSEFMDPRYSHYLVAKKENDLKMQNNNYPLILFIVSSSLIILIHIIYAFVYDPWKNQLIDFNGYAERLPIFVPIMNFISVAYLYQIYDRVFKYFNGACKNRVSIIFTFAALMAVLGEACYPHFLLLDSLDVALLGITSATLLNDDYYEAGRTELINYGLKCLMIGLVFAFAHIFFSLFNQKIFPDYITIAEMIMMTVLIGYSHVAHMTREFLYGRRMDISGQKIKKGNNNS